MNGGISLIDEKVQDVLAMYEMEVLNVSRGRGAFVYRTTEGVRLLKAYPYSENHLIYESLLKSVLAERGYLNIDSILYNKEGQLLTAGRDGRHYVMKKWFEGQECDLKDKYQVEAAVKNMAVLHGVMKNIRFECPWMAHASARPASVQFAGRDRELRTIRSYIRNKKMKNEFDTLYMRFYDRYAAEAKRAGQILSDIHYEDMYREALAGGMFCHGEYSHHHVLIHRKQIAVINFDKSVRNLQIYDLYYFLRKALEKSHWDIPYGMHILQSYDAVRKLTAQEKTCLYAFLLYPEKFWKIANHYFNSRKSWTSAQNFEKLKKFTTQAEVREKFLEAVRDW